MGVAYGIAIMSQLMRLRIGQEAFLAVEFEVVSRLALFEAEFVLRVGHVASADAFVTFVLEVC